MKALSTIFAILIASVSLAQTPQDVREKLLAADVAGLPLRPIDLTQEEFAALAQFCRVLPGVGFSQEQRDFMRGGYLLAPSVAAIDAVNAQAPGNHRLGYRVSLAGEALIPADAITCYRPGEPFAWAAQFLAGCRFVYREEDKFPQPEPLP